MLYLRHLAMEAALRRDLAARGLVWRTVQVLLLASGCWMLSGAWTELSDDGGDHDFGQGLLILGGALTAVTAATLAWGMAGKANTSKLLHAWSRVADYPPAGAPVPPGHGYSAAPYGAQIWSTTELVLRQQNMLAAPPPGAAAGPTPLSGQRAAWATVGALGAAVGAGITLVGLLSGSAGGASNDAGQVVGPLAAASWGGVLLVAGVLSIRKSLRFRSEVNRTEARAAPSAPQPQPTQWGYRRGPGVDLLAKVTPGGRFDRWHRSVPTAVLAAGVGLVALGVAVAAGGVLGRTVTPWAAPLLFVLALMLGGYMRTRPVLIVLALVAGIGIFLPGLLVGADRVLEERGEWTEAVVVDRQEPPSWSRESPTCTLEALDGRPLGTAGCNVGSPRVGQQVEVIVDPLGEVSPSFSGPAVRFYEITITTSGVVFTAVMVTGTALGHRHRLRTPPAAQPAASPGWGPGHP